MFPFSEVIKEVISSNKVRTISGLWGSSRDLFLSLLFEKFNGSIVVITSTQDKAEQLLTDISFFSSFLLSSSSDSIPVYLIPFWELLPYDNIPPHPDIINKRMSAYNALLNGVHGIFIIPVQSMMQRIASPECLIDSVIDIRKGMQIERDSFIEHLVRFGFEPSDIVTGRGFFSIRGGIIDIFSHGETAPVRIELFGDTIESIRTFDPDTQRTITLIESSSIMPAKELSSAQSSLIDYLPEDKIVVLDEINEIKGMASEYWKQIWDTYGDLSENRPGIQEPDELYISDEEISGFFSRLNTGIIIEPLKNGKNENSVNVSVGSSSDLFLETRHDQSPLKAALKKLDSLRKDLSVILISPTEGQAQRMRDVMEEHDIPATVKPPEGLGSLIFKKEGIIPIINTYGNISSGFIYPEGSILLVTEEEILGKRVKRRPSAKPNARTFISSFQDIKPGDYVVHVYHGVGQYDGLKRKALSGGEGDFLSILFAGGDYVYVPVDKLELVQKYVGSEGHVPHIDKLQSTRWENTKKRVQKAVEEIASELVELYAAREIMEGFSFSNDNYMLKEFETSFEYEETPDQLSAIEDVKKDMESHKPMDRLVCGDVGYGKTEVALRAACKAVIDNKQAAVLVPTTLLAQQHFQTFSQRFAAFPLKVEMLSRFRTAQEQKEIIKGIADGTIDIIIGTQRLLQKDVCFSNLGLVVVDEEQRFGVAQKEKLKQLRKTIDVLTLSATPIPRTLQMSLFGIRDLSIIETPPEDRLAIRTIISPFDKRIIHSAILREFSRGGRVFFVHNRVESIAGIAAFLQDLIPEANIGVAHGQMKESVLEDVMIKFINGEYNLMVCTAIIESGLDIPSANTIIINRADLFGLSELYQLRGRVGRSGHQAYAYLLVPGEESLTGDAKKRIKAIQELTELGAGFKLAIKDLEIRGSGNLLGKSQSGHISSVGFELYSHMLEDAVKKMRGEQVAEDINPVLNLQMSAFIPENYIESSSQRLSFYKRLASVKEEAALLLLKEEMVDRYGMLPPQVENLFRVMDVKIIAVASKVEKIEKGEAGIFFTVYKNSNINAEIIKSLMQTFPGRLRFISDFTFLLLINKKEKEPETGFNGMFTNIINCLKVVGRYV